MHDTILIADDMKVNRMMLRVLFEREYKILEAENGIEVLQIIADRHEEIAVLLLDVVMPKLDGIHVLKEMSRSGYIKVIPVILITGSEEARLEEIGYTYGVSDIIRKPFDSYIVKKRVENIWELYRHKNDLEELVEIQTQKIKEQNKKIKETNDFIIDTLSTVVEFRDSESGSHVKRIKSFTKILLKTIREMHPEYGLTKTKIEKIINASAMHDIGKIAIPDNILLKKGKLTPEEYAIMKTHTTQGCAILEKLNNIDDKEFYQYCYDICRSHHERADGTGYPDGLLDAEIPLSAKIVSIADVYDALTNDRVYKKALSHDDAINMILNSKCGVFSDDILECLCKAEKEFYECSQKIHNREIEVK